MRSICQLDFLFSRLGRDLGVGDLVGLDARELLVEYSLVVGLFSDVEAQSEHEGEKAEQRDYDSSNLPSSGVATVGRGDDLLNVSAEDEPESNVADVLDAHSPVEDEESFPALTLRGVLSADSAHGEANSLDSTHEDLVVPLTEAHSGGVEGEGHDENKQDHNDGDQSGSSLTGRDSDDSNTDEGDPESSEHHVEGVGVLLGLLGGGGSIKSPADSSALQETDDDEESVRKIVVDDIEENESKIGTEW